MPPPSCLWQSKCEEVLRVKNLALLFKHNRRNKCHFDMPHWSSSQGSECEKDPCSLLVTPCGGWIEWSTEVCLSHWHLLLGTQWLGCPLLWLYFWRYGSESEGLLAQFTLAPQSSQIGVCIVQHLFKRTWIWATLADLIRTKSMNNCKTCYGSLQPQRIGHSSIWQLQYHEQTGETVHSKNCMFKMSHWMGNEVAAVPR